MKIALTGTPGTGKSATAAALAKLGYHIIDLNAVIFDKKLDMGFDHEYQSTIADIPKLNKYVSELVEDSEIHIFEGHLAHHLDMDAAVVLRTHPETLEKRLKSREYPEEKIKENVEAEALAVITTEAMENFEKIYEVDTTEISIEETVQIVMKIIEDPEFAGDFKPGKFNWMEAIV
jgi:adenylate kinase